MHSAFWLKLFAVSLLAIPICIGIYAKIYNIDDLYKFVAMDGPFEVISNTDNSYSITTIHADPIYPGDTVGYIIKACRQDDVDEKLFSQIIYKDTGEVVQNLRKEWDKTTKHCDVDKGFPVIIRTNKEWRPGSYLDYRTITICGGSLVPCQNKELPTFIFELAKKP